MKCRIVVLSLILLTFWGCEQRFFYLNKINIRSVKGTYVMEFENNAHQVLSDRFIADMENSGEARLAKDGYRKAVKNPDFRIFITIGVDSSLNRGWVYGGPLAGTYSTSSSSRWIYYQVRVYSRNSSVEIWSKYYDIYYYSNPSRDAMRSKGVVSYLMHQFALYQLNKT